MSRSIVKGGCRIVLKTEQLLCFFLCQIAAEYAAQPNDNFAVVVQPFVSESNADNFPVDYLSSVSHVISMWSVCGLSVEIIKSSHWPIFLPNYPSMHLLLQLDCFHPSLLAHQNMAVGLWNNMITPSADKKTSFTFNEPIKCPINTTLLYTYWPCVLCCVTPCYTSIVVHHGPLKCFLQNSFIFDAAQCLWSANHHSVLLSHYLFF